MDFPSPIYTQMYRVQNYDLYRVRRFRYLSAYDNSTTYEFFYPDGRSRTMRIANGALLPEDTVYGEITGQDICNNNFPKWLDAEMIAGALQTLDDERKSLERLRSVLE